MDVPVVRSVRSGARLHPGLICTSHSRIRFGHEASSDVYNGGRKISRNKVHASMDEQSDQPIFTSGAGPVDPKVLRWLQEYCNPDPTYIEQAEQLHGTIPDKPYFDARDGKTYRIGRFLTLVDEENLTQPAWPSWEYGGDARIDWSVSMLKDGDAPIPRGLGDRLLPFAVLYAGDVHPDRMGTGEYGLVDLVCFYTEAEGERPKIVVWLAAESPMDYTDDEDLDYSEFTIPVAPDFDAFVSMLRSQR